ncbi:MAG: hypothetical protein ACOYIK_02695 [Coriobacteriales bacterium]
MKWDFKDIGRFGFKIGYSLEPAWFTLWRDAEDYRLVLFYIDEDEEVVNTTEHVPFEVGDPIIAEAIDNGHVESWDEDYNLSDDELGDDPFTWSLDLADTDAKILLMSHGMGGFPKMEDFQAVLTAVRKACPDFGKNFEEIN